MDTYLAKKRIPYPRINFERMFNYLLKIRATYPTTNALTKHQIVSALGLSPTSGTAHTALGALSHYGLASKVGPQNDLRYHLTDLAFKIIETRGSKEWTSHALKATISPEAFDYLHTLDSHYGLPDDTETRLISRYEEINISNAKSVIKLYRDSISFINRDLPTEPPKPLSLSQKQYEIPLGNGMVISANEEVIAKALKHYLKDLEIE